MKLFCGTVAGLPLLEQPLFYFGDTLVHIDKGLACRPGAIVDGRLARADLTRDERGRLTFMPEHDRHDTRALVVIDLPLYTGAHMEYAPLQPERLPVRVSYSHIVHTPILDLGPGAGPAMMDSVSSRYHAIAILSQDTGVAFKEVTFSQPLFGWLRRRLGGNPQPTTRVRRYSFWLQHSIVTFSHLSYTL